MAKALKYFYEFSDIDADDYKVEIWVEGFAGTATELKAGGNPLTRTYNKDVGEKYLGGIVPFVVNIEAISSASFHAVDFTGENYGDAVIVVYKNTVLQYNAIIVPFEGADADLSDGIYSVNLSAECGLVNLKTITYEPNNTRKRLIDVIRECINNIPYVNTFGYTIVDDIDLKDADLNSPFYYESYIEDSFFEGLSCYDVINSIIQQYGQFCFTDARWDIKNIAEISKQDSVKKQYSYLGILQATSIYTRPAEEVIRLSGGNFGLMFSSKSVTIEKSKSISRSLNPNSGFNTPTGWTFEGVAPLLFEITNGYLTNKGNTWFTQDSNLPDSSYVQSPSTTYYPFKSIFDLSPKQELKVKFKSTKGIYIKNLRLQILSVQGTGSGTNTYYLTNEGTWYKSIAGVNTPIYAADFQDNVEKEIPIPQVPYLDAIFPAISDNIIPDFGEFIPFPYNQPDTNVPYQLYVRVFMPERIYEDFTPIGGSPAIINLTTQIDYFDITVEDINSDALNGFTKKFGVESQKDRNGDLTIKMGVGYPSYPISYDSLFFDGSTTKPITTYNDLPIEEFIAESYLSVLSQRQKFYQGTVKANIEFGDLLDIDGEIHRIHNFEYNYKSKQANIKTIGLGVNADTIEELPVYDIDINLDIDSILKQVNLDMNRRYGDNLNLKFVDKNIEIKTLADGQKTMSLRQDFRISTLYSNDLFLRTVSEGSIQDVAEDTAGNFTIIKPAKDGTYALLEDIEDLAWLQAGNTATVATKKLGTLDNFDFNIVRNSINIGQIKSTGLDLLDNRLDVGAIQFNVATAQTHAVAKIDWNDTFGTLEFGLKGGNVAYRLGQSSIVYVKHADNSGLTKGTVVYTVGSDGVNKTVRLAQANAESTSNKTFGIIAEAASGGSKAFCVTFGNVEGLNTSALTEGAAIYLSPTVAGGLTMTKPSAPNHMVLVGFCLRSHATQGVIFVKVQNGFNLDELHNVAISSLANNNILAYEAGTTLWKNKTFAEVGLASGTGTLNYLPKWSNATGGLVNSQLFDNATNVGIGTVSPASKLDIRGQVSANLGSLANPAYSFVGDLNTGLYSPSADALTLVTGGVNRLNISSAGDINIGAGAGFNSLIVNKNITGGEDASGIRSSGQFQSDVITTGFLFRAVVNQANYAPTALSIISYESQVGTISGTGTNLINFRARATNAGFTNVYGFQSTIASGTGRYGAFFDGTAQNHFRGNVGIGSGKTVPAVELDVAGTIATTNFRMTSGAAVGRILQSDASGNASWVTPSSSSYLGTWNANTNTPTIADGTGTAGQFYIVTVAGTWNSLTFAVGDQVYYNGTIWQRIPSSFTLPVATASVLGGVKISTGLTINGSGDLSVSYGTTSTTSATGDHTHTFGGDVSGSGGTGTIALTLATVNSNVGTFNNVTVNAKGLVTGASNVAYITGNESISITGDGIGTGTTSIPFTLATVNSNVGTFRSVTVNAKGLVTSATNPTTLAGYGITEVYTKTESDARYQLLDADLTAIAALAGTSGILRKTALNAWSLDTASYFVTPTALTTNYVSKWGGSAFANSQLFDNGTNIGIGTTSPTFKLDIVDSTGIILRHSTTANTSGAFRLIAGNYNGNGVTGLVFNAINGINQIYYGGGSGLAEPATQHQFYVGTYGTKAAGSEVMRIANSGFVGINTTTPAYTLDVAGTIRTASILITTGASVNSFLKCNNVNGTSVWSSIAISDISNLSTWTGSTSITTLGTIATGVWNGTAIGTTRGGTGLTALGTANQIIRVNAGATALEYFTPTYISGNQTITLSGIVTGSGTTAITTAIADGVLSIAKTSGLQTALDAKQATLSGTGLVLSTAGVITYVTNNSANWNTAYGWGNHASAGYLLASTASTTYQPLDGDLTAIAGLSGTAGILRKTALNTWSLDTNSYLTGNESISITGDATGSGTTAIALTLANVATEGTYRSVTVNAKGLVTSGTNPTTISGYGITDFYSQVVSGFVTGANSSVLNTDTLEVALEKLQGQINARITGNQTINITGDVLGSGTIAITATLATVTQGTTGDFRKITLDTKGRVIGNTAVVIGDLTALGATTLSSFSSTATGLSYNVTTGVFSMTSGYTIPTTLAVNQIAYANSSGRLIGSSTLTLGESRYINLNLGTGNAVFGVVDNNAFAQAPNGDLRLEAGISDTYSNKVISISNHEFLKGIRASGSYGTAGQVLSSTGTGVQWVASASALPSQRIAFGSALGVITSSENLVFDDDRIIRIKNSTTSMEVARRAGTNNYGLFVGGGDIELWAGLTTDVFPTSNNTIISYSKHNFVKQILLNNSAGTAGQVLTSQGPSANPTWTTVSGGGFTSLTALLANTGSLFSGNIRNTDGRFISDFTSTNQNGFYMRNPAGNIGGMYSIDSSSIRISGYASQSSSLDLNATTISIITTGDNGTVRITGSPIQLVSTEIELSGTSCNFNDSALSVATGQFIVLEKQSTGKYLVKKVVKQTVGGVNNVLVAI